MNKVISILICLFVAQGCTGSLFAMDDDKEESDSHHKKIQRDGWQDLTQEVREDEEVISFVPGNGSSDLLITILKKEATHKSSELLKRSKKKQI
jgi:hypothetical protein